MAFPSVSDITETSSATDQSTHTVDIPATVDAGDLLILAIGCRPTLDSTPTGWTELISDLNLSVYARVADGSEDGGTVSLDWGASSSMLAAQVLRIASSSWGGTLGTDVDVGTYADGASKFPDPPSVTAGWGSDDNLFIVLVGGNDDDQSLTNPSTNYSNLTNTVSGGGTNAGSQIASMTRELASDSDDPGAIDRYTSAQIWAATTLVIKPAAAGGTTAPTGALSGPLVGALGGPIGD